MVVAVELNSIVDELIHLVVVLVVYYVELVQSVASVDGVQHPTVKTMDHQLYLNLLMIVNSHDDDQQRPFVRPIEDSRLLYDYSSRLQLYQSKNDVLNVFLAEQNLYENHRSINYLMILYHLLIQL